MNTAASTTHSMTRCSRVLLALATAAWLTACGGGAGGVSSDPAPDAAHADATGNADGAADAGATRTDAATGMFMVEGSQFLAAACAADGGVCNFSGSRLVAYGGGGQFVVRSLSGPVSCSAAVFGTAASGGGCHLGAAEDGAPPSDLGSGDRSLTLTWQAPLTNEDGSSLTDLAGYRVYYGSRSGNYGASVAVNNPAALSHRLESLAPGTYYVVVKAINSAGAQSIASPEASKTIQ